jgi:flagellar motor switch protein FliG
MEPFRGFSVKAGLSAAQKVGILLQVFGEELAVDILRKLPKGEAVQVANALQQVGKLPPITDAEVAEILDEFVAKLKAPTWLDSNLASRIIEKAIGKHALLPQLDSVRNVSDARLAMILQREHPQSSAIILALTEPRRAAAMLSLLPSACRTEILVRLVRLEPVAPEVIADLDEAIRKEAEQESLRYKIGGIDTLVRAIAAMNETDARKALEELDERDPKLAETIRERMFTFEDIGRFDDLSLQKLLRDVRDDELSTSLRGVDAGLVVRLLSQLSSRRAESIREELSRAQPRDKVIAARRRILEVARAMIETGEADISRKVS